MAGGSHSEWRSLIGLVLLLAVCSLPHGYRLLQQSNPSDATIGWWLQRLYFVIQGMWLAVFVVRTRGDPSKDEDVAAVHTVVGDFPGGLLLHLWLPIVGSILALLFFAASQLTDPGVVTVRTLTPEFSLVFAGAYVWLDDCAPQIANARTLCEKYGYASSSNGAGRCQQCSVAPRPARTHHCGTCGVCVRWQLFCVSQIPASFRRAHTTAQLANALSLSFLLSLNWRQVFRFDHHCYWMGACIGARNLRWFMAFVFIQGLTYIYGALYMLLALWATYCRAMAGDSIILRFLALELDGHQLRSATLSALVYKCADILMLLLIATGASAWLVDMFVKKAREICDNRSAPYDGFTSSPLPLHLLTTCHVAMRRR